MDECEILDKERRIPTFSMHNMYCIACMMNMMYMTSVLYEYEEYEYGYCEGIVKGWPR